MEILAGTSGYSYKEWLGSFYPPKLPAAKMLEHYAGRLPTVEINNTFYQMPKAALLDSWMAQVPESFRFSVKASRRITHIKRLADVGAETGYFLETVARLGPRLLRLRITSHRALPRRNLMPALVSTSAISEPPDSTPGRLRPSQTC